MKKRWRLLVPALAVMLALLWWLKPEQNSLDITTLAKPVAAPASALSARVIAQGDLPAPGTRSLFDHLLAQNDGLPYPFEKLVALIRAQDPEASAPVSVLIPQGRSLLKAQADAAHPRVLLAADFQAANAGSLGIAPRGQLFLGFVEKANEIEVLSYNEAGGRFEFQLVQNYCAGCVPRIVYARRAICTTCHQGGGPIFPQRPWNETNGQAATAETIRQHMASLKAEAYQGVPLRQPLAMPERFDQLTDMGNFLPVTQRLWLDGCGEKGNDCRRGLLRLALQYADSPGSFDTASAPVSAWLALQKRWFPAAGIAVPESDLFNRDPLSERQGLKGWWHGLWVRDITPGEGARDNEDLEAFDRLPKLSPRLDPLTPRPPKQVITAADPDAIYGVAALFTASDLDTLLVRHGHSLDRVLARVDALPDSVFAPRPVSRVQLMNALLGQDQSYCCLDTSDMSPPQASGVPPLKIVTQPVLRHFERYCFACHRGNPAARLNFMAGATEAEVLANIQAKSEIRDALDWERYEGTDKASQLMPPRDSVQYRHWQQDGERARKAREAMRDVVPGLFSF